MAQDPNQQQQAIPQQMMQPQMMAQPGMGMAAPGFGAQPQMGAMPSAEPEAIRNLMINYIPGNVDEMQMRQLLEMYGPIESIKIVRDRETRQSKGFGFVKYRFAGSATQALTNLNGYPLLNKRLKVAYAQAAEAQQILQQGAGFPQQMMQPGMAAPMMAPPAGAPAPQQQPPQAPPAPQQ